LLITHIDAQDLIERKQNEDQSQLLKSQISSNNLFSIDKTLKSKSTYDEIYLKLDYEQLKVLKSSELSELLIPVSKDHYIDLKLQPADIYAYGAEVKAKSGEELKLSKNSLYTGYVGDDPNSRATVVLNDKSIQITISDKDGHYNLGAHQDQDSYVLFNDRNLGEQPFTCENDQLELELPEKIKQQVQHQTYKSNDCVKLYLEADYTTYVNFGSDPQQVINFLEGAFLEVFDLYATVGVPIQISEIQIWTTPDSYNAASDVGQALQAISSAVPDFNGDMMHLVSATGNCCGWSGVAYVNFNPQTSKFNGSTICGSNPYGVSQTTLFYESLPVYSWTVNVLAHELGHNLGAPHTHECLWGNNYDQAIDACVSSSTSCADPGLPATGTIMSYCHTRSDVGISLGAGFHPQVAQHLLQQYQNMTCLTTCGEVLGCTSSDNHGYNPLATVDDGSCSGTCSDGILNGDEVEVDCGGNFCDACPINCDGTLFYLDLVFDRYGEETNWDIQDDNGNIVAEGGTYADYPEGASLQIPICLEDGEYTFTIYDGYGDGICCEFGDGSYTLHDESGVEIVSGGDFTNEEGTMFNVVSDNCGDGIQNGNEQGVDCGGLCAPCATCDDGVQNGDEEGVDCGGACASCATCDDGIQNGNEEGVDCGGACASCATCDDGIQNGDEQGVDCGGSCAQCATCDDGIQNGNEQGVDCGGSCAPCATSTSVCDNEQLVTDSIVWNFESNELASLQGSTDDLNFTRVAGSTPSNGTGPQSPIEGNYYVFIESSSPNYPNKTAKLELSCLNLTELDNPRLLFRYHMDGVGMGDLEVEVINLDTDEVHNVWSISGNQGNEWHTQEINLSAYNNGYIDIYIKGITGSHFTSDIALDHIVIMSEVSSTCYDGIQNGDEEGIDCGGPCEPCMQDCQTDNFTFSNESNHSSVPSHLVVRNRISSDGTVQINSGANIVWQAGETIEIGAGFSVAEGASVIMKTEECLDR
jgi:hypothetical protein